MTAQTPARWLPGREPALARVTPFTLWLGLLATIMVAGLVAGVRVFADGLAVTNLTDLVPWGLWITLDLSSIALSAGAFSLCAAVYLLRLERLQPLARTATFIGLIGYSMAVMCLMLDIGRPERFWHALVYWNPHSVLWEVTMCVTLYFNVLLIEAAPLVGEAPWFARRWPRLGRRLASLHRLAPYLAVAGLCLSLLHQSSLGATYGVLKARPIWFRPDQSVLFFVSAVAAGQAATVLASMLAARLTRRAQVDESVLETASRFIGWLMAGYLYLRLWDALSMNYTYLPGRSEAFRVLTAGPLAVNFWLIELALGALVPAIILLWPALRRQAGLRLLALALIVIGVVTYRWDVNLVGQMVSLSYLPQDIAARYTAYQPSGVEMMTAAGIVAYGLMAFSLGVRHLGVVRTEAH